MEEIKQIKDVRNLVKYDKFLVMKTRKNSILKEQNILTYNDKYFIYCDVNIIFRYYYDSNDTPSSIEIFNKKTKEFDIEYKNYVGIRVNNKINNNFLIRNDRNFLNLVVNFVIEKEFTIDKGIALYYDDLYIVTPHFLKPRNQLECFKLGAFDKQIWHFKLPEGFTISGKIQLIENVIFFRATISNRYKNVYGLDINTGKVLWKLNFQRPYKKNFSAIHINKNNNLAYGYGGSLYQVFNPITGKIIFEKDMSSYYKQGIAPDLHRNTLSKDTLWFVSGYGNNAKFGAININTHKMIFIQDYPLDLDYRLDAIIYHQNKLYLSDTNNVLHIFEKQENETT